MSSIYDIAGDGATAVRDGVERRYYAVPHDTSTEILEEDFIIEFDEFSATAIGTAHATHSTFYLVEETPRIPVGGSCVRWTKVWAKIPTQRSEYESYAMRIPGLAGNILVVPKAITGSSASAGQHTLTVVGHGYSVGDGLIINTTYPIPGYSPSFGIANVFRKVNTAPTADTFTVNEIVLPGTVTFHTVQNVGTRRASRTEAVNSRLQFDYYLPGVSGGITTPSDITILQPTQIVDSEGNEVDTYSDATTPSQATYLSSTVGTEVVVEESVTRRWQGNIYERITRYAEAR